MKLNNFDLLRIFAASQVMITHSAGHLSVGASSWRSLLGLFPGVPIFFVISGFLISASYERNPNLINYARNRSLRIYPALWCCVLITIPVAIFFGINFVNSAAPPWVLSQLIGLIYTPYFLKNFGFGSYNGSLWTIPVELQFYIVLPLLYWLIRKTRNQTLYLWIAWFVFIAISFILYSAFPLMGEKDESTLQKLIRYSFFPHFYLFLTGLLLQRMGAFKSKYLSNKGFYWLAGYLLTSVYLLPLLPISTATSIGIKLLLALTVVSAAYTNTDISHKLLKGYDISYGVYIYHGLMINIFISIGLTGSSEYLILLCGITYLLGYFSWIGIERPFLRWKKQPAREVAPFN